MYDDAAVTRVDEKFVLEREAYLLFYRLKINSDEKIRHNVKSHIKLIQKKEYKLCEDSFYYIPAYWFEKLQTLRNPGMIHTSHLLCHHGLLKPDYYDCFPLKINSPKANLQNMIMNETSFIDQSVAYDFSVNALELETNFAFQNLFAQSITLPKEIVIFLREKFGGGPFIKDLTICQECLVIARNIRKRKKIERNLISKYDNKSKMKKINILTKNFV